MSADAVVLDRVSHRYGAVQAVNELSFSIRFHGGDSVFRIRVFMDDIDAPDVCFLAPPALTHSIRQEFARYTRDLGLALA